MMNERFQHIDCYYVSTITVNITETLMLFVILRSDMIGRQIGKFSVIIPLQNRGQ